MVEICRKCGILFPAAMKMPRTVFVPCGAGDLKSYHCSREILKAEFIGDKRDKFRVCGLSARVVDGVAENAVKNVNVAAVPRDLNSVADSAFNAGGSRAVFLRDGRIKQLRYAVHHIIVIYREDYCRAQVVIALDVRGNTYLMDYVGHYIFDIRYLAV